MGYLRTIGIASTLMLAGPACEAQAPQGQANAFAAAAQPAAPAANAQVFQLPEGARVHDVAPAPDGTIWYTAQRAGALGILDPRTGKIRHVPLGEGSAPHGVIQGPDGAAWITDSGLNAIVRFDPKTEKLDVWKLPADVGYANLNTGAFDGDGVHWFTGQNGIYGRLDPKTGAMRVFRDPDGRGPYGIAATPSGEVYYVSLAGSHLARIDRKTGAATIIEPPTPAQGARRVWSDSKGNLWVSEWNSGNLSRYTPASGEWKMWKLPGEGPKAYAVYVDDRDIVWVSDFGANAVLAFDPRTEQWTTYPGSGEGANVRQILGRPGEVYLPESGTNRIIVVKTGSAS
jgi:virginiamycin B lyase